MAQFQPVVPQLVPLLQVVVTLAPALSVGATALGQRRIINITGGHFTGQTPNGALLAVTASALACRLPADPEFSESFAC